MMILYDKVPADELGPLIKYYNYVKNESIVNFEYNYDIYKSCISMIRGT